MNFLTQKKIRDIATRYAGARGKSVEQLLIDVSKRRLSHYDIFLSQTIRDAEIVFGVYLYLTDFGYTVFCDWIAAPEVDRSEVSPENAAFVRKTMAISDCLVFLDTQQADQSLWMCWEIGWFDGSKGKVCVVPVLQESEEYREREFLGLYPYVVIDALGQLRVKRSSLGRTKSLILAEAPSSRSFSEWKNAGDSYLPHVGSGWRD